jgi:hypothetical protein
VSSKAYVSLQNKIIIITIRVTLFIIGNPNTMMMVRSFTPLIAAAILCFGQPALASDANVLQASGQLRLGYIDNEQKDGPTEDTLALGGRFGFLTPIVKGVSAGLSFYSSNALFGLDENRAFLNAQGDSYSIVGESWVAFDRGNTQVKAGRLAVDTPFADTDDIVMLANAFEGVVVTHAGTETTALTLLHLRKWVSRDNELPEKFTDMNDDKGVSALGVTYTPIKSSSLQAWHYQAPDLAAMTYLEAGYGNELVNLAVQYTKQTDETDDDSGLEGDAWGVMADYSMADFTLAGAYNHVSGEVGNGFGGGPYFTSTEDHTIDAIEDERATMLALEYTGFGPLTLAWLGTDFDKSEDETDWIASYAFNNGFSTDIVFSDMSDDGKMTKVFVNYDF